MDAFVRVTYTYRYGEEIMETISDYDFSSVYLFVYLLCNVSLCKVIR